jgi:hypothetical protein
LLSVSYKILLNNFLSRFIPYTDNLIIGDHHHEFDITEQLLIGTGGKKWEYT